MVTGIKINLKALSGLNDRQFYQICRDNSDIKFERGIIFIIWVIVLILLLALNCIAGYKILAVEFCQSTSII
jgi:hypothetical protein